MYLVYEKRSERSTFSTLALFLALLELSLQEMIISFSGKCTDNKLFFVDNFFTLQMLQDFSKPLQKCLPAKKPNQFSDRNRKIPLLVIIKENHINLDMPLGILY